MNDGNLRNHHSIHQSNKDAFVSIDSFETKKRGNENASEQHFVMKIKLAFDSSSSQYFY